MYHPRVNKVNCLFTSATSGIVHRLLGFIECKPRALMGMWGIIRLDWSRSQTFPGCR